MLADRRWIIVLYVNSHHEETMWQQRSRIRWLEASDKNTLFFHLRASQHKKKNRIQSLKRSDATITEDAHGVARLTTSFTRSCTDQRGLVSVF
jgi:hypothetical protein